MSRTTAFPVPASAEGKEALEQEGALVQGGATEGEGTQVRERHWDERLQSRLRGGDHARSLLFSSMFMFCFA
jgi:hypothetical protein